MLPALIIEFNQRNIKDILHSFSLATHYDPAWYKAWHTWALANFEVVSYTESQSENRILDQPGNDLVVHIVQSVDGKHDPSVIYFKLTKYGRTQVSSVRSRCETRTLFRTLFGC